MATRVAALRTARRIGRMWPPVAGDLGARIGVIDVGSGSTLSSPDTAARNRTWSHRIRPDRPRTAQIKASVFAPPLLIQREDAAGAPGV